MNLTDKKTLLRRLHHEGRPLILPNVWDAASARVLALAGFPAIATASAAVAESLGYADEEGAPVGEMFAAAARVTRAIDVPVSVDAEAGYGLAGAELAARLREAGAAGCNIEDTVHARSAPEADAAGTEAASADAEDAVAPGHVLAGIEEQAGLIAALRKADPDLVVNARVDAFLPAAPDEERLEEAVTRARAYLDAGADSIYPIMVSDESLIRTLVERIPGPVNILYRPGSPSLARLAELGVARVTFGPGLHRMTLTTLGDLAERLRAGNAPY